MKKRKVTKHLIDFITFAIAYMLSQTICDLFGINYNKILSFDFVVSVIIITIVYAIVEFFMYEAIDICDKRKKRNT